MKNLQQDARVGNLGFFLKSAVTSSLTIFFWRFPTSDGKHKHSFLITFLPLSYHRLRARPFPGEEVPEVGSRWRFALLLRRLSHPDAALRGAAQTAAAAASASNTATATAAAAQGEAQRWAQRASAFLGVRGGRRGGLGQAEQVVVGVELTHVADWFTWRDLTWKETGKGSNVHFWHAGKGIQEFLPSEISFL